MKLVREHIEFKRGVEPSQSMQTDGLTSMLADLKDFGYLIFKKDKDHLIFSAAYTKYAWDDITLDLNFSTPDLLKKYFTEGESKDSFTHEYYEKGESIFHELRRYSLDIMNELNYGLIFKRMPFAIRSSSDIYKVGFRFVIKPKYRKYVKAYINDYVYNPDLT